MAEDAWRRVCFLPWHSWKRRSACDDGNSHSNGHPIRGACRRRETYHGGKEEEHHYTDALIKRAITQGLEADGKVMDWTMPRWQMSEDDFNALIEYLKTLE